MKERRRGEGVRREGVVRAWMVARPQRRDWKKKNAVPILLSIHTRGKA
jgi:hypothetical protein